MIAPETAALPWPLVVLDFEASSLDQDSYPVEVGIAVWASPESRILRGFPARAVAAALDALLGAGTVAWCDGGDYDQYWLDRLYAAAGWEPSFQLGDWLTLVGSLGAEARGRVTALLAGTPARHRARPDAEALLQAMAYGLGIDTGPISDLAPPLALGDPP